MSFVTSISERIASAITLAYPGVTDPAPELRRATRSEFGDFQTSVALRLGAGLGLAPRVVAATIIDRAQLADLCSAVEVAGPGFINLTLTDSVVIGAVNAMAADERLGVPPVANPRTIVIDYSGVNVAKQMHVGHLRSTVLGDAIARLLGFLGHRVIRQNHLGDWGTQFGMLIAALDAEGLRAADLDLTGLAALYRRARLRFDADPEFAAIARAKVVALQAGDPATLAAWRSCVRVSLADFADVYATLGTLLTEADIAGESGYNAALPGVVDDLETAGLLEESDGALCAFPAGFTGRDGERLPVLVRKNDGGFGYDATDLAALRHRVDTLGADSLVYVVDARQSLHFEMLFALARQAGWLPADVTATHVAFGSVLGDDGRPFKTRSGTTVTLSSLLAEAVFRAESLLLERGSSAGIEERKSLARAIGIGAVRYADLSHDLSRDYVFSLDRMLALDGNTGPYLQYANARFSKLLVGEPASTVSLLDGPADIRLAKALAEFPTAVADSAELLRPHVLCGYLFGLATTMSAFYESSHVLTSTGEIRSSRLALCALAVRVMRTGLELLGIEAPARL